MQSDLQKACDLLVRYRDQLLYTVTERITEKEVNAFLQSVNYDSNDCRTKH